jgi:hypothetical protein
VQTEDKGLDSPLILSLVYAGGEILASKRSRYEDLIAAGFDEDVLAKRLKRQHRLICAAINAGRLDELKRMSGRGDVDVTPTPDLQTAPPIAQPNEVPEIQQQSPIGNVAEAVVRDDDPTIEEPAATDKASVGSEFSGAYSHKPKPRRRSRAKDSPYTPYDPRNQSRLGEAPEKEAALILTILDEAEFRAGESFNIRILVEDGSGNHKPLMGVSISVKILGTTFRPQIYSVRSERDGVAAVSTTMPNFTSGRAAVLVRAVANGETTELRRVIHPAP